MRSLRIMPSSRFSTLHVGCRLFSVVCRQLALFHGFGWLLETVEHILVTDGHLDAASHDEAESGGQDEEGEAMQEDEE